MKHTFPIAAVACLWLAACSPAAPEGDAATSDAVPTVEAAPATAAAPVSVPNHDDWIGRWVGVEGLFADIQPAGDGTYRMEMQSDLDTSATYTGTSTAEGIAFERDGETLTLRATDGTGTGLKWLDGKQDCLVVQPGEGFCRD